MSLGTPPFPSDWSEHRLGDLLDFSNGVNAGKAAYGRGVRFANVMEVVNNEALTEKDIPGRVALSSDAVARYLVRPGDVLFNRTSETQDEVGMTSVYVGEEPVVFGGFVFRGRPRTSLLDRGFSQYVLRSSAVRGQIIARSQGAIRANVGQRDLKSVRVFLPGKPEQEAIASVLDDIRSSIVRQSALVAKKRAMHLGLTQVLLTGRIRLPGFAADWKRVPIAEVLEPRTERNAAAAALEVLSCTKHQGFVRSLDFFKNQVFSRDLSNYLVIHHGDIGYPANHVEEGSIGVQELAERGLVSPIYVVMRPVRGTDTFFLHRQLKLDSFRQEFARATNASVNRRGSLRWPEFSRINVSVPEPDEQRAIASAIRDAEAEIAQLQREVEKLRNIKQGVAQQLLNGSTRLPGMGAAA
ncbi:restriction endonuclease subunit S [Nocardioides sp. T2.26MG-1]|uniref:restriction endonuclease subunit S n=1 Tax=Nocardioides sp. T2.26MG-1 TaxID=3041166 RepID=UPI002477C117|nr:restriction endonuclease subunit S [Nocardioides sp. T2.26MG-1]CAI9419247.1 hypothetical protein HIDPHFAB_03597 [Nocardioides sp. T2.26MG-1]